MSGAFELAGMRQLPKEEPKKRNGIRVSRLLQQWCSCLFCGDACAAI